MIAEIEVLGQGFEIVFKDEQGIERERFYVTGLVLTEKVVEKIYGEMRFEPVREELEISDIRF